MKNEIVIPPGFSPLPTSLEWKFELKWRMGARTAIVIMERAKLYQAKVFLTCEGLRMPLRGIMDVMLIGNFAAAGDGRMGLTVRGPEAMAAFMDFVDFFGAGAAQTRCPTSGCDSSPCLVECGRGGMIYSCMKFHSYRVPRSDEARRN